ncbi:MAG TPA: protease inhibitor I42 family protein [Thermoleophilia bacterium]|nr:protease inhibitor I42 family protein [Thermoleophilia bacterium]
MRTALPAFLVAVTLAAALVLVTACGRETTAGPVVVTEADDGAMRVAVGDRIVIRLGENPSTGFTWTLQQSRGLKLLGDDLEQDTASPGLVDAPATRVFELEVAGAGTQMVEAVYHRPWEHRDDTGTREFTLTVRVE